MIQRVVKSERNWTLLLIIGWLAVIAFGMINHYVCGDDHSCKEPPPQIELR